MKSRTVYDRHGPKPKGLTRLESLARAEEMAQLRDAEGLTLSEIGERYGVTLQCVHQVLKARAKRLERALMTNGSAMADTPKITDTLGDYGVTLDVLTQSSACAPVVFVHVW
jgi:predicted DNA-binding protein (UPF0251 family)